MNIVRKKVPEGRDGGTTIMYGPVGRCEELVLESRVAGQEEKLGASDMFRGEERR